jgi:hypothetical protein
MGLIDRLDDIGKPAWIGLMILGFIAYWPAGVAILAYLIWSGRMGCWRHGGNGERWQRRMDRMHDKVERMQQKASRWAETGRWNSSGNRAFDEYRDETLRRLEEEQREFFEFLDRLRHAKDKAEFDQFMAERGRRGSTGPSESPQT